MPERRVMEGGEMVPVLPEALDYVIEGSEEGDIIAETVAADLRYRAELGRRKYGTYLTTNNGRDALIDLYEELIDALVYATQYNMQERSDASAEIAGELVVTVYAIAEEVLSRNKQAGILEGRQPENQPRLFEGTIQ